MIIDDQDDWNVIVISDDDSGVQTVNQYSMQGETNANNIAEQVIVGHTHHNDNRNQTNNTLNQSHNSSNLTHVNNNKKKNNKVDIDYDKEYVIDYSVTITKLFDYQHYMTALYPPVPPPPTIYKDPITGESLSTLVNNCFEAAAAASANKLLKGFFFYSCYNVNCIYMYVYIFVCFSNLILLTNIKLYFYCYFLISISI